MADATAPVPVAYRRYTDDKGRHSFGTAVAAVNLYNCAMLGLNAGYVAKFDDTASMKFLGIVLEKEGNPIVVPISTAGDGTGDVDFVQPTAFELAISGVAITDIGRRVYALDDQTGTLDPSATTYANLIGVVKDLIFSTNAASPVSGYALVAPIYNNAAGARAAGVYRFRRHSAEIEHRGPQGSLGRAGHDSGQSHRRRS